jgi:ParB family transcriptional regulator, chromosome partitioning protein
MRKNLLASITSPETSKADHDARSAYAARGASRSMMISIDEMAENAKKMIAGESIVSLDAKLIEGSFVSDRIGEDDDYAELRNAIKAQGQVTPVLLRPHPGLEGHYMIVFGHRRVRAARELGIPVRAVVKDIEDIAHVIAQGQENTARANLSFIEKALFAKKLLDMGQRKDTIKSALTIDDTLLSRMLSVSETVPMAVIEAIGAARSVGRDRWEDLKKLVIPPASAERAKEIVRSTEFLSKDGADRFNHLLAHLRIKRKAPRKPALGSTTSASWAPEDKAVEANYRNTGKTFRLSLTSKDAGGFGQYISSNLETLYRSFKEASVRHETGD